MSGKFLYKTLALKQKIYINIEKNVKNRDGEKLSILKPFNKTKIQLILILNRQI